MTVGLALRRIHCPFCAEPLQVELDLSAGDQDYIEDCQVCCQPMRICFAVADGQLISIDVLCS
ncbi:MAG: CPXCG motif-containing cysteine-rich protein [Gammaproteobacteria bacterium]|nr:CPXCG motif-containing cysteine-rich protein [Gammaproteobacteria bacterium]MDH4314203.1 CPXCG motif-containing cysteine-rich protein [Gammaproteobacteria bacterium]MDH5213234.1 CPXCG motif-containing cysteine-rich protein [Gammaproteobacteria bacterium]